jgi:hypothetical protein
MTPDKVHAAIETLANQRASLRCRDVIQLLEGLGFEVRAGRKAGHKIVLHQGLADFYSAAFTCGHGRDPEIKPVYTRQLQRLLEMHADALRELTERQT